MRIPAEAAPSTAGRARRGPARAPGEAPALARPVWRIPTGCQRAGGPFEPSAVGGELRDACRPRCCAGVSQLATGKRDHIRLPAARQGRDLPEVQVEGQDDPVFLRRLSQAALAPARARPRSEADAGALRHPRETDGRPLKRCLTLGPDQVRPARLVLDMLALGLARRA